MTALTGVTMPIDDNSRSLPVYSKTDITLAAPTTTVIKTGAGILHSVTVTKPASTGTIKVDDAITDTNPMFGTITSPATLVPYTLIFDIAFTTGLTIITATAAQEITVTYL